MQLFGKTIPYAWTEVLRTVQSVHPEAVLAGGCLRDLILGGEVKDLDIFIGPDETNLHEVLTLRHGWRCCMQVNADYVEAMHGEVGKVHGYRVPGLDLEVQIIQLKRLDQPSDAIERMDFAACQVGTTGFTHVWSPAAERDLLNQTITMLEPEDAVQARRSWIRGERFERKYAFSGVEVIYTGPGAYIG